MPLAAQLPGVDPTPFTAWGVLGLLGLVIVVLMAVLWKIVTRQSSSMETRDKILMEFVDRHRGETTAAMTQVAATVSASHDKMTAAFSRQARALDEVLMTNRVLDQIDKMKTRGVNLTTEEIDRIVRSVLHERAARPES